MKRLSFGFILFSVFVLYFSVTVISYGAGAKIKTETIKGYITQVNSLTSFEIDDYKVTIDGKYEADLENIDDKAIKFDPRVHLRVGTLVKMKCKVNTDTLEAWVEEITVDVKQFRRFSRTVVLDEPPTDLFKSENGSWDGTILADARRIRITNSTSVRFKLNKSEEKLEKEKAKREKDGQSEEARGDKEKKDKKPAEAQEQSSESGDKDDGFSEESNLTEVRKGSFPLQSLNDVGPGVYMTYVGTETLEGDVVATEVVFVRNEKTKEELKMWKDLQLREKQPKKDGDFIKLKIGDTEYKELPDAELQEYVSTLGNKLIPRYQKLLPEEDQNKIPFRFVVVYQEGINAGTYPNGTIVINHGIFKHIENEAQLAFLLSHEIAHATQEHQIRQANSRRVLRGVLKFAAIYAYTQGNNNLGFLLEATKAAIENGYARTLENQADRIGMANMIVNGYDPREAARLWKVSAIAQGEAKGNFFWQGHASDAERRSYLMLTLRNSYPSLDYSTLKKTSTDFDRIVNLVSERYTKRK